jgi:hypothetical protein
MTASSLWALSTITVMIVTLERTGKIKEMETSDIVRVTCNSLNIFYGITFSYSFLVECIRDLDRKIYMLK